MTWHYEEAYLDFPEEADPDFPEEFLENFHWECALTKNAAAWREIERGFAHLGNISLIALNSAKMLDEESKALHHCVASYWRDCVMGRTRIFSVMQNGAKRATLEIRFNAFQGQNKWHAAQLKGSSNEPLEYLLIDGQGYELFFSRFCETYSRWQPTLYARM